MRIAKVDLDIRREALLRPFGFKGGHFTEKWLCQVELEGETGRRAAGQGGLAVLWSDAEVFSAHTETGGNLLMAAMLEHALQRVEGQAFDTPIHMLEAILQPVLEYGKTITGRTDLRTTFALNSLVALDNAAWILYARERNLTSFGALVPEVHRTALRHRHQALAGAPLISYKTRIDDIRRMVGAGCFFLKIKIGHPGGPREMLAADMQRLSEIHEAVGGWETPHTPDGKLRYYLDANGRYPDRDLLRRFLDHARKIGAFEQIAILEEPFDETLRIHVGDLGVRVAGDESCHGEREVRERVEMGYGAIALKPAGKTLSMSLRMATAAHESGVPCFVADSACPPLLVEWNKNVAARLAPLPGMHTGLLESNGAHYYVRWRQMIEEHPCCHARWLQIHDGLFCLDEEYYAASGGIFLSAPWSR